MIKIIKKFSQIINVISKYKNRLSQNLIKPNEIEEQIFNNLGIKLKIISSYHTHGLYNREKKPIITIAEDKFYGIKQLIKIPLI